MWCWRKVEKIDRTYRVRNEGLRYKTKKERNILNKIHGRNLNLIGHISRKNCLLRHVIEGKIKGRTKMKGRGGRRRKQLRMTLRKREDNGNRKIALCGEIALAETMDLP
jgi:hypothetical protein